MPWLCLQGPLSSPWEARTALTSIATALAHISNPEAFNVRQHLLQRCGSAASASADGNSGSSIVQPRRTVGFTPNVARTRLIASAGRSFSLFSAPLGEPEPSLTRPSSLTAALRCCSQSDSSSAASPSSSSRGAVSLPWAPVWHASEESHFTQGLLPAGDGNDSSSTESIGEAQQGLEESPGSSSGEQQEMWARAHAPSPLLFSTPSGIMPHQFDPAPPRAKMITPCIGPLAPRHTVAPPPAHTTPVTSPGASHARAPPRRPCAPCGKMIAVKGRTVSGVRGRINEFLSSWFPRKSYMSRRGTPKPPWFFFQGCLSVQACGCKASAAPYDAQNPVQI